MIMNDLLFDPSPSMSCNRNRKKTNKMMLNEKVHYTLYSDVYRVFRPKIQFHIKYNSSFVVKLHHHGVDISNSDLYVV